jgi:hypothetical protein
VRSLLKIYLYINIIMTKTENSKSTKAPKAQTEQTVTAVVEDKKVKKTSKKEETPVTVQVAPAQVATVEEKKSTKKSAKKEETPVTAAPTVAPLEEKKSTKKSSKKEETQVTATTVAPVEEKKSTKKSAKKAEPLEKVEEAAGDDQTGGKKRKRYFRCVYRSKAGEIVHAGRYSGKKPKQAARKALTRIADKNELTIGESVTFLIQECTRGSKKKKYSYTGSRVNLPEPVKIQIAKKDKEGNKTGEFTTLEYLRDNVVKKISLKECGLEDVDLGEDGDEVEEEPVVKVKKATKKSASKKVSKKASTKKTETKSEAKAEPKVEVKTETKTESKKSKPKSK